MWTKDKFLKEVKPHQIFRVVIEEVDFMTGKPLKLIFVAVRGEIEDWALYCIKDDYTKSYNQLRENCRDNGDKVTFKENIKHIMSCSDDLLELYRY